jgi:hypothetical protein
MEVLHIQSTNRMAILAALLCLSLLTSGQQTSADKDDFAKTVEGISDYELASIQQAGDSGNIAYIPHLRALLTHDQLAATPIEAAATIALAKLGDREQMKKIECGLMTNNPGNVDYIAQKMLPEIKGWFSIREYFYMLNQDAAYAKELQKHSGDVPSMAPPSHWAVKYLSKVVPHPTIPEVQTLEDIRIPEFAREWRTWILYHRTELEQIAPQGPTGLTFSDAGCPVYQQTSP